MAANPILPPKPTAPRVGELNREAAGEIHHHLRRLLADVFALYMKTKGFQWHLRGRHFRDYSLLLDEHAAQLLAMTDRVAERTRKIGGATLRSIGDVARYQTIRDQSMVISRPLGMLQELHEDNRQLTRTLGLLHEICWEYGDVATACSIASWIDEAEGRAWHLMEATRDY
jgi:starvation-inducible DNA-binding protein